MLGHRKQKQRMKPVMPTWLYGISVTKTRAKDLTMLSSLKSLSKEGRLTDGNIRINEFMTKRQTETERHSVNIFFHNTSKK